MSLTAVLLPETAASYEQDLAARILSRTARVGVIGMGYVGLPLAVEFAQAGFNVTGFDLDSAKVAELNQGRSYVQDVPNAALAPLVASGLLHATTGFAAIASLDTIHIAVPTPLRKTKDPDLSYILEAARSIASYLKPGTIIVLESTTYPGTTNELLLPLFERSGLTVGRDFFLCFSPERVDPGNPRFQTRNIPKVIGGITPACTRLGKLLYEQALETVVPVSSTRVAEMVKLVENTYRMINIAMVNEMALLCDRMDIDVWEVIDAAATKPFGFVPFYPGPGLGGHCIPIDPFYLSWKSKENGMDAQLIELAGNINARMPRFAVEKVQNALNSAGKPLKDSRIHILGVAYKRDIPDVRESPALDIIHLLEKRGAIVSYSDPLVPVLHAGDPLTHELRAIPLSEGLENADCVLIVTDHRDFDYLRVIERARLIVDTRNALKGCNAPHVVRL